VLIFDTTQPGFFLRKFLDRTRHVWRQILCRRETPSGSLVRCHHQRRTCQGQEGGRRREGQSQARHRRRRRLGGHQGSRQDRQGAGCNYAEDRAGEIPRSTGGWKEADAAEGAGPDKALPRKRLVAAASEAARQHHTNDVVDVLDDIEEENRPARIRGSCDISTTARRFNSH
jgi:hypothetical protein